MQLKTFQFIKNKGWSLDSFPTELDSENTLVLIFAAPIFSEDSAPIQQLKENFPAAKMIGCSTAGEIFGSAISDNTIVVAIAKFEKTQLKLISISIENSFQSKEAGNEIANQLKQEDLKAIFILSEGLNINGSELVSGVNAVTNNNVIVTGGLAGDGDRFKKTWSIINGQIETDKIVAVGFYGDAIRIGHGSRGGWDIFGPERRITRATNNILYELDGKPALQLYKEYLGEKASGLPATGLLFPLAIRKEASAPQVVRTILGINQNENSLTFAGDMPVGYLAQLMRANFDRLISGATQAGELTLASCALLPDKPLLLIAISCVGRRLLLGERTEEETESVLQIFPSHTQQIGFYSYGELSPQVKGTCALHNQTMTLTIITEED
ncbi:MAG: FIST N-terminal domain-containing protein [Gammaproteobacteria bacterium]